MMISFPGNLSDFRIFSRFIMNFFNFQISVQQNPAIAESLVIRNYSAIAGFSAILQVQQFKSEDLVVRKFCANAGFSAILQYAIAGFYCIFKMLHFYIVFTCVLQHDTREDKHFIVRPKRCKLSEVIQKPNHVSYIGKYRLIAKLISLQK